MPIFDYECKKFGYLITAIIQKPTEADLICCPNCKEAQLEKKLSTYGFWLGAWTSQNSIFSPNDRASSQKFFAVYWCIEAV